MFVDVLWFRVCMVYFISGRIHMHHIKYVEVTTINFIAIIMMKVFNIQIIIYSKMKEFGLVQQNISVVQFLTISLSFDFSRPTLSLSLYDLKFQVWTASWKVVVSTVTCMTHIFSTWTNNLYHLPLPFSASTKMLIIRY